MDKLLSLCMIVRDEEKVLQRCLDSVQGLVDEIIIIDTGSVDHTKEIAYKYTNNVFDYVWIQDFSAAKNEAIRKATSKWILVLDADEYVTNEQHLELREFLVSLDYTSPMGFIIPIFNFTGAGDYGAFVESSALRLFPNLPDIHFERPIHEQVVLKDGELPIRYYNFTVFHTGYTTETRKHKEKSNRNLAIFDKMKEKQGFGDYDFFTLGNEYFAIGDKKKALYYYKRAASKRNMNMSYIPHCLVQIASILIEVDQIKEALELTDANINRWPQFADFHCFKATIFERLGYWDQAAEYYHHILQLADEQSKKTGSYWLIAPKYGSTIPLSQLSRMSLANADIQKAVYYLTKLINLDNNDPLVLYQLLMLLQQNEDKQALLSFISKIYPNATKAQTLKIFNVCLLLGNEELSKHFYEECLSQNIPLENYHRLYLALISKDRYLFDDLLQNPISYFHQAQVNKLLCLASVIWQEPRYLQQIKPNDDVDSDTYSIQNQTMAYIFKPSESLNLDINFISSILIDLFKIGYYEAYDCLIQRFPNYYVILANLMGDHFFSQQQIQLAIDYYSVLLRDGQLSGKGYENLARLYIAQGDVEEGIDFLYQAIHANSKNPQLYPLYFNNCTNAEKRQEIMKIYNNQFPHYYSLNLIKK